MSRVEYTIYYSLLEEEDITDIIVFQQATTVTSILKLVNVIWSKILFQLRLLNNKCIIFSLNCFIDRNFHSCFANTRSFYLKRSYLKEFKRAFIVNIYVFNYLFCQLENPELANSKLRGLEKVGNKQKTCSLTHYFRLIIT